MSSQGTLTFGNPVKTGYVIVGNDDKCCLFVICGAGMPMQVQTWIIG